MERLDLADQELQVTWLKGKLLGFHTAEVVGSLDRRRDDDRNLVETKHLEKLRRVFNSHANEYGVADVYQVIDAIRGDPELCAVIDDIIRYKASRLA